MRRPQTFCRLCKGRKLLDEAGRAHSMQTACQGPAYPQSSKSNMTTSYERTRALLATRAFLQDLLYGEASELPAKSLREEARTLLRHFVLPADLMPAHCLAPDWFASPDEVKKPRADSQK